MSFQYQRTIRFQDTDAAGVVYFANVLAMCHEAYEEYLVQLAIDLKTFFTNSSVAIPIAHADVDFYRPMFCGDRISITITPQLLTEHEFTINYQIFAANTDQKLAIANTRHVCIDPSQRQRQILPEQLYQAFTKFSPEKSLSKN